PSSSAHDLAPGLVERVELSVVPVREAHDVGRRVYPDDVRLTGGLPGAVGGRDTQDDVGRTGGVPEAEERLRTTLVLVPVHLPHPVDVLAQLDIRGEQVVLQLDHVAVRAVEGGDGGLLWVHWLAAARADLRRDVRAKLPLGG